MSDPKFVDQEASIVLIGSFNPTIFHPEWFARHDVVPEVDLEGSDIEIIHPEIAKFTFPWVSIEVLQNRFIVRTKDVDHYNPLRDFVISTFSLLEHSPIKQLGMNLTMNYTAADEDAWHKIGDTLAPKPIWQQSLPDRVGLLSLRVQSQRSDDLPGKITVSVESRPEYGVNIGVNSHVDLVDDTTLHSVLSECWEQSVDQGKEICATTIREALK